MISTCNKLNKNMCTHRYMVLTCPIYFHYLVCNMLILFLCSVALELIHCFSNCCSCPSSNIFLFKSTLNLGLETMRGSNGMGSADLCFLLKATLIQTVVIVATRPSLILFALCWQCLQLVQTDSSTFCMHCTIIRELSGREGMFLLFSLLIFCICAVHTAPCELDVLQVIAWPFTCYCTRVVSVQYIPSLTVVKARNLQTRVKQFPHSTQLYSAEASDSRYAVAADGYPRSIHLLLAGLQQYVLKKNLDCPGP